MKVWEAAADVWDTIKARIAEEMSQGGALDAVKSFESITRFKNTQLRTPVLYVMERAVRVEEWSAFRGVAVLEARLGFSATSLQPSDAQSSLETLAWTLVQKFLNDPTLGDKVDDTMLVELRPDDSPFGPETTQPWATVTLIWRFQFEQQ